MTQPATLRERLINSIDWAASPLAKATEWPESLSTVLNLSLASRWPTIVLWGPELIQFYNEAYCELFGRDDKAQGQSVRAHPSLLAPVAEHLDAVLTRKEACVVDDMSIAVGNVDRRFAVSYSPLFAAGDGIDGIFISMTETTPKVMAERTYKEVLSAVSHDLRSPLSTILVGTVLAERQCSVEDEARAVKKYTSAIRRSAERMTRVIGEIVDCANLASGQLEITRAPCRLQDLLPEVVAAHAEAAEGRGLPLTLEVLGELPEVSCDRERVGQVLSSILASALRHTPAGGEISLRAERIEREVVIRVHDTGSGTRTGVGLSVARGIIVAHGGRFEHESAPGDGTTYVLTLPV